MALSVSSRERLAKYVCHFMTSTRAYKIVWCFQRYVKTSEHRTKLQQTYPQAQRLEMTVQGVEETLRTHAIILAAVFLMTEPTAEGGMCFQSGENGTCKMQDQLSSGTRDECCKTGSHFYVDKTLTNEEEFRFFLNKSLDQCLPCAPPPPPEVCDNVACPQGKLCKIRSGKPTCVCSRQCKDQPANKVCGSDGDTYHNECLLNKKACIKQRENLKVAYDGRCRDNCNNVTCREQGKTCVVDQNKKSHCISCDFVCSNTSSETVCGTDEVTYKNGCDLRIKACRARKTTGIAYYHSCVDNASCSTVSCPAGMKCLTDDDGHPRCVDCQCSRSNIALPLHEVCGTDNVTYSNHCQLLNASCTQERIIEIKHTGKCYVHKQLPSDQPDPSLVPSQPSISVVQLLEILKKLGIHVSAPVHEQRKELDVKELVKEIEDAQSRAG